jgi:hypothetical protein
VNQSNKANSLEDDVKITLTLLFVCVTAVHFSNAAVEAQDLGRTNNLVNQALQLADSARANSFGTNVQVPMQQNWSNPFSSTTTTTVRQPASTPGVAISGSNIRVNAGGMQLDIPRTGAVYPPSNVNPVMGIPATNSMQTVQHWRNFADAINSFQGGQFDHATSLMQQVNPSPSANPAFNHFHSLCTFAEGNFDRSAEYAYAGLAQSQPIYSWDQLRGYYKDPAVYAQQYQSLQTSAAAADASASTQFLLGYHHLMLGHRKHAAQVLEHVLTRLPNDPVIQRTLTISQQLPPQPQQ